MKKETNHFTLKVDHEVYTLTTPNPKRFLILLHGHMLDGSFMLRKFARFIKEGYQIISPNAPFLIPHKKENHWEPRYTWYFYNEKTDSFFIDPTNACDYVTALEKKYNLKNLPVDIVGYSQGGFFAPKLCESIPNIERIIGMACIFKKQRFKIFKDIEYHIVHGLRDDVVLHNDSLLDFKGIKELVSTSSFTSIDEGHLLSSGLIKACHNILELK